MPLRFARSGYPQLLGRSAVSASAKHVRWNGIDGQVLPNSNNRHSILHLDCYVPLLINGAMEIAQSSPLTLRTPNGPASMELRFSGEFSLPFFKLIMWFGMVCRTVFQTLNQQSNSNHHSETQWCPPQHLH